jgi:hypothetical protein
MAPSAGGNNVTSNETKRSKTGLNRDKPVYSGIKAKLIFSMVSLRKIVRGKNCVPTAAFCGNSN